LRNEKASQGKINKLEEKRLAGKPVENEKYEASSKTAPELKWWQHLKTAQKNKDQFLKTAREVDIFNPKNRGAAFEMLDEIGGKEGEEGLVPDHSSSKEVSASPQEDEDKIFDEEDSPLPRLKLEKKVEDQEHEILYYALSFNPLSFDDNEDRIKEAALQTVLALNPKLQGEITTEDFLPPKYFGGTGTIALRIAGPAYFEEVEPEINQTEIGDMFSGFDFETDDSTGTPVGIGRIKLNEDAINLSKEDPEAFDKILTDYLLEKEPRINALVPPDANLSDFFNHSSIERGEITFAIGATPELKKKKINNVVEEKVQESPANTSVSKDFPIVEDDSFLEKNKHKIRSVSPVAANAKLDGFVFVSAGSLDLKKN
jgi:hypothetical protein